MAELPPPGSSSNKGKVYYKEKDVRAVFGHILNPRFVQRILEIIPVHNIPDESLSVSQPEVSSEQSTFRDHSVSSPIGLRSRGTGRPMLAPESNQRAISMWLGFVEPHQEYRSLPLRTRDLHGGSSSASPPQNASLEAEGVRSPSFEAQHSGHAGSTRTDATIRVKPVAETSCHLHKSPAGPPSASATESSALSDTIEMSTDQSHAAI